VYNTDAAAVVVTLTTGNEHTPPLDKEESYFLIGTITYIFNGLGGFYNFNVDQRVKLESEVDR
jgi:hypothetical protein